MTLRTLTLIAVAAGSLISPVQAGESVSLTPPLYREQARGTAAVRPVSELVTTPRLVPAAPASRRIVATRASAE